MKKDFHLPSIGIGGNQELVIWRTINYIIRRLF
jgi:hypothetical protein